MRAVLDCNVLISSILSPTGPPAEVVRCWRDGEFELVVSAALLTELERVLGYDKIRDRLPSGAAAAFVQLVRRHGSMRPDPDSAGGPFSPTTDDPDDQYLIRLAVSTRSILVSGDADLTSLGPEFPVHTPTAFLALLDDASSSGS